MDRIIAKRFACGYMSDTKWRKLLSFLHDPDLNIRICMFKLIDSEKIFCRGLPGKSALYASVIDDWPFNSISYREIEWLSIPGAFENGPRHAGQLLSSNLITHNLDKIESAIHGIGRFKLERTSETLMIYAYALHSQPQI